MKQTEWPVIVVATTSDEDKVPADILSAFKQQVMIKVRNQWWIVLTKGPL